jgi:hypothetical protein
MSSARARIEGSDIHLLGVELNQNAVAFPHNLHSHEYNIVALWDRAISEPLQRFLP